VRHRWDVETWPSDSSQSLFRRSTPAPDHARVVGVNQFTLVSRIRWASFALA